VRTQFDEESYEPSKPDERPAKFDVPDSGRTRLGLDDDLDQAA